MNPSREQLLTTADLQFLERHPVGHLATVDSQCRPTLVPVCFVVYQQTICTPLDEKPKSVGVGQLARVRNIRRNPEVAFLADDYRDDWKNLGYLLVRGTASLFEPSDKGHGDVVALLRQKYAPYVTMRLEELPFIRIVPRTVSRWSWTGTLR